MKNKKFNTESTEFIKNVKLWTSNAKKEELEEILKNGDAVVKRVISIFNNEYRQRTLLKSILKKKRHEMNCDIGKRLFKGEHINFENKVQPELN